MRRINWEELSGLAPENITGGRKTALTVGVFDGLHRGHRALVGRITREAPELLPAVITFRSSPHKKAAIVGFEEKMTLLEDLGVELSVIIDFSPGFAIMSGSAFFEALERYLCPAFIALGTNFHCGYRRDTDAGAFKALAEQRGIRAEIIPPVMEGGAPVSSSRIRAALKAGRYGEAALLLGRPFQRA